MCEEAFEAFREERNAVLIPGNKTIKRCNAKGKVYFFLGSVADW